MVWLFPPSGAAGPDAESGAWDPAEAAGHAEADPAAEPVTRPHACPAQVALSFSLYLFLPLLISQISHLSHTFARAFFKCCIDFRV